MGTKNTKLNKVISMMLCLCMIMVLMPAKTACAVEQQVQQSVTVSADNGYPDDVIDVVLSVTGEPAIGVVMPSDVVMVMDVSGSMSSDSRITRMQAAAKSFVSMLDYSVHQVGVVAYQSDTDSFALSNDALAINAYIDTLSAGGGTRTDLGIAEGVKVLNAGRSSATKVLIVLTDGETSDVDLMLQAAETAKNQNIVIFTVALLASGEDPLTSMANLNMEAVATSDGHHHIVLGSAGLQQAYDEISQQIGVANVYNVRITQQISEQFEYVAGSADNNIPKPVVSGNALTWSLAELREETLTLSYQIRIKSGIVSGAYPHASGTVSYKTYFGAGRSVTIDKAYITVNNYPPEIISISQSDFDIAGGDIAVISGKNFQSGAVVKLGGSKISNAVVSDSNTITFTMPSHAQGTENITVTNPTGEAAVVPVRFMAEPVLKSLSPVSGVYEGNTSVTLSCQYVMDGAVVTFDGVLATVSSYGMTYLKCKTPFIGKAGTVDVTVTNPDGTTATLVGAYTYNEKPVPPAPSISKINPTSQDAGVSKSLTISGADFQDGDAFSVSIGGVECEVSSVGMTYVKVETPDSLSEGTYDIVLTNGDGQTVTYSGYTYNAAEPADLFELTGAGSTSQNVGTSNNVTLLGKNFQNGASFSVTIGGVPAEVSSVGMTYAKIKTPDSLPAGTYDIVVVNGDGQTATLTGAYTYNAVPVVLPVIRSINPASAVEHNSVTATISISDLTSGDSLAVSIGGISCELTSVGLTYIKIKTPDSLAAGTYDVVLTNGDGQQVTLVGGFTYTEVPPVPGPTVTKLSKTSVTVGKVVTVTVSGSNFSDPKLLIGDTEVALTSIGMTYLKFKTPATMPAGVYDVTVINGDGQSATLAGAIIFH